ncbi:hypothetical protein SAMN03080594_102709 [Arenibacter palladensis]|uniref:Uncharacterized protein n=1 Tax=Arenibacter palladensis TaxID=237373 RepID=A0A1M4Z7C1_9FLAO|nr:hypothetical protein [Arenibacter palladensis]MDO6601763.1 hypothetical protein [Arenibacter palladensis]SHF13496.1 hypothetical protein SAMN03080594_102709 [Arenibacter palladensis]
MIKDIYSAVIVLVMVFFLVDGNAQSKESDTLGKKLKVEKWTVLEEYEPDMILSAEDRMALKKKRFVEVKRRKGILDTMDISDRKRKRLMRDLYKNPFSDRLMKTLADTQFEDDGD